MSIDSLLISLVSDSWTRWYLAGLIDKVYRLKAQRDQLTLILDGISEVDEDGNRLEYTEGFRAHLVRRIAETDATQQRCQTTADYLTLLLSTKP